MVCYVIVWCVVLCNNTVSCGVVFYAVKCVLVL